MEILQHLMKKAACKILPNGANGRVVDQSVKAILVVKTIDTKEKLPQSQLSDDWPACIGF